MEKPKKDYFLLGVVYLFIGSLVLLAIYFATSFPKKEITSDKTNTNREVEQDPKKWMNYTNDEFMFSLAVPRLLTKGEVRNEDGYKYLLILGENRLSTGKGVAIGITDRSVDDEIQKTKTDYQKEGTAELIDEKAITVGFEKGIQLSYKPKGDDPNLEPRDIVIVRYRDTTFSISTHPDQMEYIIRNFQFL